MPALAAVSVLLSLCGVSGAATYTWDASGNGSTLDGSGAWTVATANWWNGGADQVWNNAGYDTAVFGPSSGSASAYTVTLSGSINAGGITFQNQAYTLAGGTLNLVGAAPTVAVNASGGTIASVLAGYGALTKTGTGVLTLTSSSNFSGNTLISGGTLMLANSLALQNSTLDTSGSGALSFGSLTQAVLGGLTGNGNLSLTNSASAPVALSVGNNNATYFGSIQGFGSLNKVGVGTLVLCGTSNYWDGTTVANGTLKLDFSEAGARAANILNSTANLSSLDLAGGTLVIQGNLSTANSQRFTGVSAGSGCSAIVLTSAGTSNKLLLACGSVSLDSIIDFTLPAGVQSAANGITTTSSNVNGILGRNATVAGTNWATTSGTAGNIVAYSGYTNGDLGAVVSNGTLNVLPTGAQSAIIAPKTFNTLNLTGSEGMTMSGSGALTLAAGGLIGNTSGVISGGTLEAPASVGLLVITPANLTIASCIADNSGATSLIKIGPGTLTLAGSNTYTGWTSILAGTLQVGNGGSGAALGSGEILDNSSLIFNHNDAVGIQPVNLIGSGSLTQTGSGLLAITAPYLLNSSFSGPIIVNGGTLQLAAASHNVPPVASPTITVNSGGFLALNSQDALGWTINEDALVINGGTVSNVTTANRVTIFNNLIMTGGVLTGSTLNAGGDGQGVYSFDAKNVPIAVNATSDSIGNPAIINAASISPQWGTLIFNVSRGPASPPSDLTVTSSIIDAWGAYGISKTGNGILWLDGSNTYAAPTVISAGTLAVGLNNAVPSGSDVTVNGTFNLNGFTDAIASLSGSGTVTLGSGVLVIGGSASTSFSGVISGAGNLSQTGPGMLTLSGSNTYTGPTTINQGGIIVNGSLASLVTVNSGGTLGGTGFLGSVMVSPSGAIAPGNPLGMLTLSGSLILSAGAVSDYLLDTPSTSAMISCSSLTLNGQQITDFSFSPTGNFAPGNYPLIESGSPISGSLGASTSGTIDGYAANLAVQGDNLVLTVVPEPSTLALLAAGTIGLLGYAWRRRATKTAKPAAFDQQDAPPILSFPSHSSTASVAGRAA